jgi:hypothetical protein
MSEFFTGINNPYYTSAFGRLSLPTGATTSTYTRFIGPSGPSGPLAPPVELVPISGLSVVSNTDANVIVFWNGQKLIPTLDYTINQPLLTITVINNTYYSTDKYEVYVNGIPI